MRERERGAAYWISVLASVIGICMICISFYYALKLFWGPTLPHNLESGLTKLVVILTKLVPLALGMTAGGYLLDRGLWGLLKLEGRV